VQYERF
jgi:DNA-directed RNA polymerase specialized sigma subunit